jgi:hypothetical protein
MLDSGASKTIINTKYGMVLTWSSDKVVVTANGSELPASNTALLPLRVLSKGAREAIVVPGMTQKALLSVGTLADNNYTTVFLLGRQGVDIYRANDVNISAAQSPILRGWQDCRGLWMVPLDEKKKQSVSQELDLTENAMNIYELPSTKEVVRFLQHYST